MKKNGKNGNPISNVIQISEILDARFRGHDELRHSFRGEEGWKGMILGCGSSGLRLCGENREGIL